VLARLLSEDPERAAHPWPRGFEGGIAHRLDVSTSGALVVANDPEELVWIRTLFRDRQLTKTYRLRVARSVPWRNHECARPIAHDPRRKGRVVVQRGKATPHRGRWREAETVFQWVHGDVFEATMSTGVMHQIRVHAAFIGIPLLGDRRYGGGSTPEDAPDGLTFFLHHVGLEGGGLQTDPVSCPEWASPVRP
jgi:23S rRNA pseudouridine1911/1915/1917 synthase